MLGQILGGLAAGAAGSLIGGLFGGGDDDSGTQQVSTQSPRTAEGQELWDRLGSDFYIGNIQDLYNQPNVKYNGMEFMSPAVRQRGQFLLNNALGPFLTLEDYRRGGQQTVASADDGGVLGAMAPVLGMLAGNGVSGLFGGSGNATKTAVADGTRAISSSYNPLPDYSTFYAGG